MMDIDIPESLHGLVEHEPVPLPSLLVGRDPGGLLDENPPRGDGRRELRPHSNKLSARCVDQDP